MKFAALILLLSISLVAHAFEPTMSVNVETPLTPVVHGVTNLPDGTNLMLTLTRPDVQYAAQSKMVVKNGRFQSQRLTYRGEPLTPGQYKIDISMAAAAFNPSNVQRPHRQLELLRYLQSPIPRTNHQGSLRVLQ